LGVSEFQPIETARHICLLRARLSLEKSGNDPSLWRALTSTEIQLVMEELSIVFSKRGKARAALPKSQTGPAKGLSETYGRGAGILVQKTWKFTQ
jgi:hypothetical protein